MEFLRDHAYWRRNFHPEDGFRISADARHRPDFLAAQARIHAELHRLSARLKRAVPVFHPRYVGHMTGDLLLPGLVAKLLTTLYNPNNVSEEAAPVTLEMELEVGEQLARMFGFSTDEASEVCAWGHLTSGGTVANYEALWNFRSLKFYPLALQAGCAEISCDTGPVGPAAQPLAAYDAWELLNLSIAETIALRREVGVRARERLGSRFHRFADAVRERRIETLGTAGFFLEHQIQPPRVLVSSAAHYSWAKGMKVLGLGTGQMVKVAIDDHMRMDVDDLRRHLDTLHEERVTVLAVVGMLGTTEFGTVDPIHEIVAERDRRRTEGLDFGIHVDGAWGGYLASVFRSADGGWRTQADMSRGYTYFPGDVVYRAFNAVPLVDSVTVDPHKLGFIPYPAGAFVTRNRGVADFIVQDAAYVFDIDGEEEPGTREKLRNLGQYILEGSKPGSAAAAVWVTHNVLPLDHEGLGRILRLTIRACETFWDSVRDYGERWKGRVRVRTPFEPDSNLICLALNPEGNTSVAEMNRFTRAVFRRMRVDPERPVQVTEFIASYTSMTKDNLPGSQADRILDELGLDPSTFVHAPEDTRRDADHLYILRHTLMNPWQLTGPDGVDYLERYWSFLGAIIDEELALREASVNRESRA
ncbi:MAG: pyridoxal-dependent decarboxylase [Longimicrobiales bacterium]|nr:pyridoxal-dependent decarboxylase [Longimicrobiales bacterium]